MSSAGLRLGMVVTTARCDGILRFLGTTEFGSGEWAGVELPVKEGKTDGRYARSLSLFLCPCPITVYRW